MPFTCSLCPANFLKTFSSKNSLSIHESNAHPNKVNHLKNGAFFRRTFIILFYNESTFRYSPAQRKYTCKFEGGQGYEQLGILLENKNWGSKKCRAGTCAYVLMQNAQQTYHVTFCWKERVYKELDMSLRCGSMHFEFNIDVRDFVEENHDENQARNLN
ncbi:hypothetical protein RhiirA1_539857 [Rhizophagus irregularis]|uniref:Uncharacterized protein n=1 Tax=Rhizophagus irregularis TaxID=588596 RepID=A0A2N0RAS7_9GLOM|nr:hypothetical protein RhiirA1_539857 [Rhizophagus irregularis]GBC23028.2 hypothetical protein GLOIN_2v848380 [Rhizophagus irregularis DAOM 181602=DAOM 197198]